MKLEELKSLSLDGLKSKDCRAFVMTIAATNAPWRIDHAVLSRFGGCVHVPLPDVRTRAAIFDLNLSRKGYQPVVTNEWLAEQTSGCSGREIVKICADMVRRMTARANPGLADVADQGRCLAASYHVRKEPLTAKDFAEALRHLRKACSREAEKRYRDWTSALA